MDVTKRAMMNVVGLEFWGAVIRVGRTVVTVFINWLAVYRKWRQMQITRRALLRMDDHMLKDIGITRKDLLREGKRLFWKD